MNAKQVNNKGNQLNAKRLRVSVGQVSVTGLKSQNEDALGFLVPDEPALSTKGMVALIADGVSSAEAGKEASETCVKNFLGDYFSTPDSWSVKTSAQRILTALNRWLYGQGVEYLNAERGYISTLSVLVIKSQTAHIFHIGDSRVYRLRGSDFEQITHDHSAKVSKDSTYLTRAMGMDVMLDVDYYSVNVEVGDLFFLSTDGVHDFISRRELKAALLDCSGCGNSGHVNNRGDDNLTRTCQSLVDKALEHASDDNLSCQLVRVDILPCPNADDAHSKLSELPFPPPMEPGMRLDGYEVLEELHASTRSQVYVVRDSDSGERFAMKTPSVNFEDDLAYIERFVLEPWIGGRIDSPHVVKVKGRERSQTLLYYIVDYIEGRTLTQWMIDNPKPNIETVLTMTKQIVKGLRAMHRTETLHQDIKPDNIMVDDRGQIILIDFGSCKVAGVVEIETGFERDVVLGTETYGAPEYKLGRKSSVKSDMFSVAVVLYEMLTGHHPYGSKFEKSQASSDFYRLKYISAHDANPMVPVWMDGAIKKALSVSPELRHEAFSEFVYDLEHPNADFLESSYVPLSKRNPLRFWQTASLVLVLLQLLTLWLWLT